MNFETTFKQIANVIFDELSWAEKSASYRTDYDLFLNDAGEETDLRLQLEGLIEKAGLLSNALVLDVLKYQKDDIDLCIEFEEDDIIDWIEKLRFATLHTTSWTIECLVHGLIGKEMYISQETIDEYNDYERLDDYERLGVSNE